MKLAVLSDIHSNYVALRKCIDHSLGVGVDAFVFLGDYLGELAYPQRTMRLLYELQQKYTCYFIKGNREDYWLDYQKNETDLWKEFDSTTGALYYTYHNLTQRDFAFFKTLSHKEELRFDGLPPMTLCHGSPRKVNEKLLPGDENTRHVMESNAAPFILCGHTHVQGKIEHSGKVVLNAGSVGVSLHGGGKAQFLLLQGEQGMWKYEFVALEYDVEKVLEELRTSGLSERAPSWCRVSEKILRTGAVGHGEVLVRAMELCREETGKCVWPDVPEKFWAQAIEEMLG